VSVTIGDVAASVGKGLFAGVVGTAAMTVSSTLEMKLSEREASKTPAQAAEKVLKVEPEDEQAEDDFSNLVHWGYGTAWGSVRGLLDSAGLSGPGTGRLGARLQVRRQGHGHGSPAPRRLRHGDRGRLQPPGPEPDPPGLTGWGLSGGGTDRESGWGAPFRIEPLAKEVIS
jgi:hypothetical protein